MTIIKDEDYQLYVVKKNFAHFVTNIEKPGGLHSLTHLVE